MLPLLTVVPIRSLSVSTKFLCINNFPYFTLDEVIKDDKADREKGLFGPVCLSFAVKYLYVHSHFSMQLPKSRPDKEQY